MNSGPSEDSPPRFVRIVVLWLALLSLPAAAAVYLPGFQEQIVFSGLTGPTALAFAPDGRVLVSEKSGRVLIFDDLDDATPDLLLDVGTDVHDHWDRGLLGLAVDPQFTTQPYVYLFYTLNQDVGDAGGATPRWPDSCPNPPGSTDDGCTVNGRVSRFEVAAGSNTIVGGEQILLEGVWCQQYPSHSVGALAFDPIDRALYVSAGDGANFNFIDYGQGGGDPGSPTPANVCDDPPSGRGGVQSPPSAEGGALRAQDLRTAGDPVSFDGTLIRIDPDTGAAMPGNPLVGGATAEDDPIVAYGLRNPFRIAVRPGTHEVWIGDVGWNAFEELNRVVDATDAVVENFGWPCYEGANRQSGYDAQNLTICEDLYVDAAQPATPPHYAYAHGAFIDPDPAPFRCSLNSSSSVGGLAFYDGAEYPGAYDDALFFADYSRKCLFAIFPGGDGVPDPATRTAFADDLGGPVDLKLGPDGFLYVVEILTGQIKRIRYSATNAAPTAVLDITPPGPAPLQFTLDASGSTDPDPGDTLDYLWDLDGDGSYDDATGPTFQSTVPVAGVYPVGVRVSDGFGEVDIATGEVIAGNTAPQTAIVAPASTTLWSVGDAIALSATGSDDEDGALPESAYSWEVLLHHCPEGQSCHVHPIDTIAGSSTPTIDAPDHEWYSYLEINLTVADGGIPGQGGAGVLTDGASLILEPDTSQMSFETQPTGLDLTFGGSTLTAPDSRTVIKGSQNSVTALSPQIAGSTEWLFDEWLDAPAEGASRLIVGPTGDATYTAQFLMGAGCLADDVTCDGVDDDCDGEFDEDYVAPPTTCGLGECSFNTGQLSCVSGSLVDTCDPRAGAAAGDDDCNGLDDDCDGLTDEGYLDGQTTTCGVGACAGNTGTGRCDVVSPELYGANRDGDLHSFILGPQLDSAVDTLDRGSYALDQDPATGRIYYFEADVTMDELRYYDPSDGSDVLVRSYAPAPNIFPRRMAIAPSGTFYMMDDDDALHIVDPSTGDLTLLGSVSGLPGGSFGAAGDIAFYQDGRLFAAAYRSIYLIDLDTLTATVEFADRVPADAHFTGLAACGERLWATTIEDPPGFSTMWRIHPTFGTTVELWEASEYVDDLTSCPANGRLETLLVDTCDPFAGAAPDDASCDDFDDDCDGAIDDDYVSTPTSCGIGECAQNVGAIVCVGGTESDTCDPLAGALPSDDLCNGLDDDCDGATDEDFVDGQPSSCGLGACAGNTGVASCNVPTPTLYGANRDGELRSFVLGPQTDAFEATLDFGSRAIDQDPDNDRVYYFESGAGFDEFGYWDPATGNQTLVRSYVPAPGIFPQGLTFAPNRTLYMIDDGDVLYTVDVANGDLTTVGTVTGLPDGALGATGDIAFYQDGRLFAAYYQSIYIIDLDTLVATVEHADRVTGDNYFTGIAGCDGRLFVTSITDPPALSTMWRIHPTFGTTVELWTAGGYVDDLTNCPADGELGFTLLDTCDPFEGATPDTDCDAFDDDCDGVDDDDFAVTPTSCGVGACASNTGELSCNAGVVSDSCDPFAGAAPDDAVCNGIDDDCDGDEDEDFTNSPSSCGVGACSGNTGTNLCINGTPVDTCDPFAGAAPDDASCNAIDDDCDGAEDEDFVSGPMTCGLGVCSYNTGVSSCENGVESHTCDPLAGASTDDNCNGLDDDCDGQTDEDFPAGPNSCGVGECAGNSGELRCDTVSPTLYASNRDAEMVSLHLGSQTDTNVDTLLFGTQAMELDPESGFVYYFEPFYTFDELAYWDPATGNDVVVRTYDPPLNIYPKRLAVAPSGQMYLMDNDENFYTVDKTNGDITYIGTVSGLETGNNGATGDFAFAPDGTLFLATYRSLYTLDLDTLQPTLLYANMLNGAGLNVWTGLAICDGLVWATDVQETTGRSSVYRINLFNGNVTELWLTGTYLNDLTSCPATGELQKIEVDTCDPFAGATVDDSCNGLDEDCDGTNDEHAPAPDPLTGAVGLDATSIVWPGAAGADAYQVVRGDLLSLQGAGDFAGATDSCLDPGAVGTSVPHGADPAVGQAFWYLVRSTNCVAVTEYDAGAGAGLSGDRDAGIAASGNDCP